MSAEKKHEQRLWNTTIGIMAMSAALLTFHQTLSDRFFGMPDPIIPDTNHECHFSSYRAAYAGQAHPYYDILKVVNKNNFPLVEIRTGTDNSGNACEQVAAHDRSFATIQRNSDGTIIYRSYNGLENMKEIREGQTAVCDRSIGACRHIHSRGNDNWLRATWQKISSLNNAL